jgi:hypothetical protein
MHQITLLVNINLITQCLRGGRPAIEVVGSTASAAGGQAPIASDYVVRPATREQTRQPWSAAAGLAELLALHAVPAIMNPITGFNAEQARLHFFFRILPVATLRHLYGMGAAAMCFIARTLLPRDGDRRVGGEGYGSHREAARGIFYRFCPRWGDSGPT